MEITLNIWQTGTIIDEYYEKDNYYIIDHGNNTKKYLIFFSGNGLYFPNTVETFNEKIAKRDRYEWQNVIKGAKKLKKFEKIIFVRDLYKTWYVRGINKRVNTLDKLAEMLSELCKDATEIVTVGNSAGGYIASLMGVLLNASAVYNFSGQYDIAYAVKDNPFWKAFSKVEGKKYQDLCPLIESSKVSIFYFYPGRCEADLKQYELVKNMKNVYSFALDDENHGLTVLPMNYQYLFAMSSKRLKRSCRRNKGRLINKKVYLVETAGLWHAFVDYFRFKIGKSNYNSAHL